jgi:hypothetical protein
MVQARLSREIWMEHANRERETATAPAIEIEVVGVAYLVLSRLVLTYFLSQNTIHYTSRALFILPAEHPHSYSSGVQNQNWTCVCAEQMNLKFRNCQIKCFWL